MPPVPSAAVIDSVLTFLKGGALQPASKPGFGHALRLSYNLIARERLSITNKKLTYRYRFADERPSVGLLTAIMDELSSNAVFSVGLPSPPGVSLQMQTELLHHPDVEEMDVVNTVTKLGRTVSHTRTDFYCATTQQPLAFSSHVKYMPTGSRITDWVFGSKIGFGVYTKLLVDNKQVPFYDEKPLVKEVIGSHLEYTGMGRARFHVTKEHSNPFGALHGGCHAMIMEQVGAKYAKAELGDSDVLLEAIQMEFLRAAHGSVEIVCETIGKSSPTIIHVRVRIQNEKEKILSEGKLRFSSAATIGTLD